MKQFKLSVMLSNLRIKDPWEAMRHAAEIGLEGVQTRASGEFAPDNMDVAARKKLMDFVKELGIEISAVAAWGGGVDLGQREKHEENIAEAFKILELVTDLEVGIWQSHIGIIPSDAADPRWSAFIDALGRIAARGEELGACLAIETGPEPPAVLKRVIETVGSDTIRVNYDPGNLILWPAILAQRGGYAYDREAAMREYMPTEGAALLGPYIPHVHAKDALVHEDGTRQEVPLGQGWVDWPRFLGHLEAAGFDGYLAIERETGQDPAGDIKAAADFLRSVRW
ncbi:MAG: sugar phosphate isomerase/epimerase family protein [Limnochordia bacterium]|jgi:L-ribulose-5-phosphate 3-epimerase